MKKVRTIACYVVASSTLATGAYAADSAVSDMHATASLTRGVGVQSLPILSRRTGDPEATIAWLRSSLAKADSEVVREQQGDRIHITGESWRLDVSSDGTAAEFSDDAVRARAQSLGAAKGLSSSALEAAGRDFIADQLGGVIDLQPGETLELEATSARTIGGRDSNGVEAPVLTTGNGVVFTREIDGVPVLGAGSKIAIVFLNDGSVESFRYDWPRYEATGRSQKTVSADDILQRVQGVMGARTGSVATRAVVVPAGASASTPIDLGADTRLQRLSCGYYDAGAGNRDSLAPVQAGCYYHTVHSISAGGNVARAAFSGAVPAAVQPETDSRWPEAALLSGMTSSGTAAPPAAPGPGPGTHAADGKK